MLEEEIKIEQGKLQEIIRSFEQEDYSADDAVFIVLKDCIELANMAMRSGEPTLMARVLKELKDAYSDMMKAKNG